MTPLEELTRVFEDATAASAIVESLYDNDIEIRGGIRALRRGFPRSVRRKRAGNSGPSFWSTRQLSSWNAPRKFSGKGDASVVRRPLTRPAC